MTLFLWCGAVTWGERFDALKKKSHSEETVLVGTEAKSFCSNHVPLKERKKTVLGKISIPVVAEVQEVVTCAAERVSLLECH
ncbi:hypothetical protein GRJ2_001216800 [Grus japonensis]|uniref:Uncharacterized protein n=1 Tax=Grus japonensis TaxID=30415 RepID=A0ABC9WQT9_GRUJA